MPSLDKHQSAEFTKLLFTGDPGTGKTSALLSLVSAGYTLRVMDFDNGLDNLVQLIKAKAPDKLSSVGYMSFRDKYTAGPAGLMYKGLPDAFANAMRALNKWEDGTVPETWGKDYVLVVDSLTMMADAAYNHQDALNPGAKEKRQIFYAAQKAVETTIANLTSESFRCNVIVIAHVAFQTRPDGITRGFPASVGKALGPTIPGYFNSWLNAETSGMGKDTKYILKTMPTGMMDLKSPVAHKLPAQLDAVNGLAEFFNAFRQ